MIRRAFAIASSLILLGACGPSDSSGVDLTPDPATATYVPQAEGYHFLAIGDWGTGWKPQYTLGARMCELHKEAPYDIVVTAGDNIYEVGAPEAFKPKFYEPFACLLRRDVEFRATLGNHDVLTRNGRPELNEPRFGMNGRNYVLREGGVRFVMVDSNDLRKRWLRNALRTEEGDRWTVVAFHFPVYSSSSHHPSTAGYQAQLAPMFENKGVDLVINGHTHVYAVTKPMHKIRYVTTGGGSASPHDCSPRWFTDRCIERYHFLSIVAGEDAIYVAAIGPGGGPIDRFHTTGRD